MVVEDSDSPF